MSQLLYLSATQVRSSICTDWCADISETTFMRYGTQQKGVYICLCLKNKFEKKILQSSLFNSHENDSL